MVTVVQENHIAVLNNIETPSSRAVGPRQDVSDKSVGDTEEGHDAGDHIHQGSGMQPNDSRVKDSIRCCE